MCLFDFFNSPSVMTTMVVTSPESELPAGLGRQGTFAEDTAEF
jgi:hypothetical protein